MNNTTLGTSFSSRMRWIDIEVLNPSVDKSSKDGQTCYPYGTFYPMAFVFSYSAKGSLAPTCVFVRSVNLTIRQAFALALFKPYNWPWAYHRATPLLFRSLLPQENYPQITVPLLLIVFKFRGLEMALITVVSHERVHQTNSVTLSHLCFRYVQLFQWHAEVKVNRVFSSACG